MRYVAISIRGSYLTLPDGFASTGGAISAALGALRADGTGIGTPSIFERVERGGAQVSLRMLDGQWLMVDNGLLIRTADEAAAGAFTEVWWPDDRISLRGGNGRFVCAEGGGGREVVVNRLEAGTWEKFYYEQVPAELLPPEPEPEHNRVEGGLASSVRDAIRDEVRHSAVDPDAPRIEVPEQPGRSDKVGDAPRLFP